MPFPDDFRPYTRENVQTLKPDQNGVYGVFRDKVAIYIGSGDIRNRLLDHLNGDNPCIVQESPNLWAGVLVSGDPTQREGELIREYDPICNKVTPR